MVTVYPCLPVYNFRRMNQPAVLDRSLDHEAVLPRLLDSLRWTGGRPPGNV